VYLFYFKISELNIPEGHHIFGRIGRKDNFHPIALNSLKKLKDKGYKFKYIIIGACNQTINLINSLGLKTECIIIDPTNNDELIHKFHNTINLFLHYRVDGECHSTAISQSLMYGVPVISHYAGYNGQEETIKNGGFVCKNENEYVESIINLCNNKELYERTSYNAKNRAIDFEEKKITLEWETLYQKLYDKNTFNTRER
jgi:glycosyltransferase involved in cell wall biosynthesis